MTSADDKLDRVEQRLTDLVVTLSNVAGDVRTVLAQLNEQGKDLGDHEQRMRLLEARTLNSDLEHRVGVVELALQEATQMAREVHTEHNAAIQQLQRFRWIFTGAGLALGYLGGSVAHITLPSLGR
jgi:DNA repair ATPase RecN